MKIMLKSSHPSLSLLLLAGCFMEGRCLSDEDCSGDSLSDPEGCCRYEHEAEEECSENQRCLEHRCQYDERCLGCGARFPQAKVRHERGVCEIEGCKSGWLNLNEEREDGCEYR